MIKLMGAVMTGSACAFFGLRMRMTFARRKKSLAELITSLELLEGEISFSINRLKKAFMGIDKGGIFSLAAENLDELGAQKALNNAVNNKQQSLCLTDADCDIIRLLASRIGKTDSEDQLKTVSYVKTLLLSQQKQAEEDYKRFSPLCTWGGVLIGMFIVILLV